jgi:hypothetical protein
MTIFSHAITFPEWVTAYLLCGKRHYDSAELKNPERPQLGRYRP